jgi:ATP-dependent Clp protease protease subunit
MYELEMMGDIVGNAFYAGDTDPDKVKNALKEAEGKDVLITVNSGGGSTIAGSAIYNMIDRYEGTVHADIIGIAASMATVIVSAADTVSMAENALYMIHNPWSMAMGDSDDMKKQADILDKIKASLLQAYVRKTGMSEEKISALMDAETWLTAQEAYDLGFVDEIKKPMEIAAHSSLEFFGGRNLPEQAKAYFKQEQTETNMSEEKQEKGKLWDAVVALVTGKQPEVKEPVLEEVVAEVPAIDFEAKCVEIEADFSAKLEAKDVEISEIKASHEEAIQAKDAELADVVAKSEAIVKAFAEEKLTCADVAKLLASDESAEEVEAKLEEIEPQALTEVIEKEDVEGDRVDAFAQWNEILASGDVVGAQKFYVENREEIKNQSKES